MCVKGSNVALGKSVYASSVDPISGPSALAATDDQPWTSVKTQATIKPWIIVDLGFQYDITAVTVTCECGVTSMGSLARSGCGRREKRCDVGDNTGLGGIVPRTHSQIFRFHSHI